MSTVFRCAVSARDRQDPLIGSAPQARRWLLIEHQGPWAVDALAGSRLSSEVLELLTRTAQEQGARPLLIRRPGRSGGAGPRAWAVSYEEGVTAWGSWSTDDDLRAAAAALSLPAPPADALPGEILLVCAHGVHDACCAIRGRPVAAALGTEWPAATWECSHVGGDRFAPNVVLLPDGVYYGLLDAANAVDTVRRHLAGEVVVPFLRGFSRAAPPAQAAIAAVHERYGPFPADHVQVLDLEYASPGRWRVELAARGGGHWRATVTSSRRPPARLTCRAGAATPATAYDVAELVPA